MAKASSANKPVHTIYITVFIFLLPLLVFGQDLERTGRNKKYLVDTYAPFWTIPDQDIIPHSIRLRMPGSDQFLENSLYRIDGNRILWTAPITQLPLPLEISYRTFPAWLTEMRMRIDRQLRDSTNDTQSGYIYVPYSEQQQIFSFRKTTYSGSFSRSISAGNRQDLTLQSSFNLQLSGDLGEGLEILAAISDEQLPLQPEGNSIQLREFDRIFVQLSRAGRQQLSAGDIDLKAAPDGYFLQYFNRLQGAQYRQENNKSQYRAAAAITRGRFVRYPLPSEEGNQGPYPLRGAGGERFIVILAGTEKVFLNGQILERGFDRDYVIDYNRGEITFMPRRPIVRESRVVVEYEYAEQQFLRSVMAFDAGWEAKNLRAYAQWYSRQDSRNPGPGLSLRPEDAQALQSAGDNTANAVISGIRQQDVFSPTQVMYALRDTTNACGERDSVLVYSTDASTAHYTARFTFVGEGKGHYLPANEQGANERIYLWAGTDPFTCTPKGAYEPVIRIDPPQQQQMLTVGQVWFPDANTSIRTELALSHLDLNRLSGADARDDLGWAGFADFRKIYALNPRPNGWKLTTRASLEALHANFRPINPYRNPEFLRDWSLADFQGIGTPPPANEILSLIETKLENPRTGILQYNFQSFIRTGLYRGGLHQLNWDLRSGNWQYKGALRINSAEQEQETAQFWRPVLEIGRRFPKLGNWHMYANIEGEYNRRRSPGSERLTPSSFAFYRYQLALESPTTQSWQWQGRYMQRKDYLPVLGLWNHGPAAQELHFSGRWQKKKTRLEGTLNYRTLENSTPNDQPDGKVLLGRLEATLQALRGAVRNNTVFEAGTGQEPKREFTFIKVAAGEGAYIWLDSLYNNDGVIQFYEMEKAPFADQADYIRVSSISNQFIRSDYTTINQSLHLEPGMLLKDRESSKARQLSRLSGQFSWRLAYKTLAGGKILWQNTFKPDLADSALLSLNAGIRQMIVFNRANPKWEAQWTRNRTDNKLLQTSGFEIRALDEQSLQIRWNITSDWAFRPITALGRRSGTSENYSQRDFSIQFFRQEAQLSWLPNARLRFQGNFRFQSDRNILPDSPARAFTQDYGIEATFNPVANTSLQFKSSLIHIQYDGNPRSPVGFAILNGLQTGNNLLWELTLDRQISRGLQLRFAYEGRKTGTNPLAHIGRAQITAVF